MKKTLLYILILGALGFGVWFFVFSDREIFSAKDASFSIRDTAAIGKIFLATKADESVKLERTPNGWTVNGKYKARKGSLDQLMQALQYQEAQNPVPEAMHNNVVKSLMSGHVKVEVYDLGGALMRTFYVGGETKNGTGTFMLMEGGSKPYVVSIPGFSGYLTPRYMPTLNDWRDRSVFKIDSTNITTIDVSYPKEPLNNFVITRQGAKVDVKVDPALTQGQSANVKRVKDYVGFFREVNAEQVLNGIAGIHENISRMPRICTIIVNGTNGYKQDVDFYFTPLNRRSKNIITSQDTSAGFDSDRLYAVMNNKQDTFIVQRLQVNKLFRMGYEFFQQDAPAPVDGMQPVK